MAVTINVLPVTVGLMACGHLLRTRRIVDYLGVLSTVALRVLSLTITFSAAGNVSNIVSYLFFPSALASFLVLLRVSRDLRCSRVLQFVGRDSSRFFGIHGWWRTRTG